MSNSFKRETLLKMKDEELNCLRIMILKQSDIEWVYFRLLHDRNFINWYSSELFEIVCKYLWFESGLWIEQGLFVFDTGAKLKLVVFVLLLLLTPLSTFEPYEFNSFKN